MTKQVKQFRYYSEDDKNNTYDTHIGTLESGHLFTNTIPIIQLGIQALPGTRFYLNGSDDPIIIGSTGIYELDFNGETRITAIRFNPDSLLKIANLDNACLLVDIVYEKKEE